MKQRIAEFMVRYRFPILLILGLVSVQLAWQAQYTRLSSGYDRLLPYDNEIVDTYKRHRTEFGGGNRLLIAVTAKEGTIYTPEFMRVLKDATEEAYFLTGVDRARVRSIFTPNTLFIEIVEGGFRGGNVVPSDFDFSPEAIEAVRQNVEKAGVVGRLVANDYTSALISLETQELNLDTGQPYEPIEISRDLNKRIRERFESENISVQIIGFDMAIGEITEALGEVFIFLTIAVVIISLMTRWFVGSWRLTALTVGCSLLGVVWNLGIVAHLGYSLDVLSVILPFLIFAVGMSHGIQMVNRMNVQWEIPEESKLAGVNTFRILMAPAAVALGTDLLGAACIAFIPIASIQELRVFTSVGVLALMFTTLIMLPLLTTYMTPTKGHMDNIKLRRSVFLRLWKTLSVFGTRPYAIGALSFIMVIFTGSLYLGAQVQVGDLQAGVPELHEYSRYNQDTFFIAEKYAVGADVLTTFIEADEWACLDYDVMDYADRLAWAIHNNPNVNSVITLPLAMKGVSSSWGEGHPKWRGLRPDMEALKVAVGPLVPSTGLRNRDCSVTPIIAFLNDHKSPSIRSVFETVNTFTEENPPQGFKVALASGNAGAMAAVNDTIEEAQTPLMVSLYLAVTFLCYIKFRCWRTTLCVLFPLVVVSVFAYALMNLMEIGLKNSTLPVAALGTGLGVDYGVYIFSVIAPSLVEGKNLQVAYLRALKATGSAVLFVGLTLSISVGTWMLSGLKFQADMGLIFSAMLLLNMFGALFCGPALAYFLFKKSPMPKGDLEKEAAADVYDQD